MQFLIFKSLEISLIVSLYSCLTFQRALSLQKTNAYVRHIIFISHNKYYITHLERKKLGQSISRVNCHRAEGEEKNEMYIKKNYTLFLNFEILY